MYLPIIATIVATILHFVANASPAEYTPTQGATYNASLMLPKTALLMLPAFAPARTSSVDREDW
jgi:hypothetical protein